MKAQPIGKVWGGIRAYTSDQQSQLFSALHNFVPSGDQDPKGAIIITDLKAVKSITAFVVYYFYDGETPPTSGPFADFLSISSLVDTTGTKSYAELVRVSSQSLPLDLLTPSVAIQRIYRGGTRSNQRKDVF